MRPDTVMIFAAGFGTRMGERTRTRPKPLLPVGGRPLIDRTRDLAKDAGISTTIVNAHYLADQIEAHLSGTGCIVLKESPRILDTGGGLKAAIPYLREGTVFTANPDVVWSGPNPFEVLSDGAEAQDMATLLLVPLHRAIGPSVGDFALKDGRPRRQGNYVYSGLQIIHTEDVLAEPEDVFSLNKVWDRLISEDRIGAVIYPGTWCDVGTPDGLHRAEALISKAGQ